MTKKKAKATPVPDSATVPDDGDWSGWDAAIKAIRADERAKIAAAVGWWFNHYILAPTGTGAIPDGLELIKDIEFLYKVDRESR